MKKCLAILVCVLVVIAPIVVSADGISVTVEGVRVSFPDAEPVNVSGRTLVPVRAVFEALGFEVDWDAATDTAIITRGSDIIRLTLGRSTFYVNGNYELLDVPAQRIDGRTMIPLRLPLEAVGYNVGWDAVTSTVLVNAAPAIVQAPAPAAFSPYEFERRVLELTNEERGRYNLPPLAHHETLTYLARAHSIDMAVHENMSHTGSDGRNMRSRIEDAGISWSRIAENVAAGQRTPEAVVEAWMNSPGHRANILDPTLTHLGVGLHRLEGVRFVYYWTQKFAAFR
jgi:uncharacterized protein YkwD